MALRGTIHISVSEKINAEQLKEAFNRLVVTLPGLTGCTACGLGGIDIVIGHGDPGPVEALHRVPGLTGAIFTAR